MIRTGDIVDFDVTSTAQTVIAICTAFAAAGALLAYLFRKLRAGWKRLQYLSHRIELMGDLVDLQLTVNHGSSLLDKVNKIEPNHAYAITQFESLAQSDQQHTITLEVWIAKLEVVERQQKFFRLLLDALLLELPDDRQNKVKALAERIQSDMDKGVA